MIYPWESDEDSVALSHAGIKGYIAINYLITRDIKLTFNVGYAQWFALLLAYQNYGGVLGGLSIVFKG